MSYIAWPSAFNAPTTPLPFDHKLPLASVDSKNIGLFETKRIRTRPAFRSSVIVPMEASVFETFRLFWRDTLKHGKLLFTADWLVDTGYAEYVARAMTYSMTGEGIDLNVNIMLEIIPDVNLDVTDTFPDAWPPI